MTVVLLAPIYSMRSYETGKYSILKDGNFQLALSRALATDFDVITILVPTDSSDFEEVITKFGQPGSRIRFIQAVYGANAVETRETFWKLNSSWIAAQFELAGCDLLVSDITGYPGKIPVVYNFNITKLPELNRPYIDKFFEQDLKSIERSLFTTVLNPRQREYILEVRPDLLDKVIVNTKCAHESLLPKHKIPLKMAAAKIVFWPFRISDKAYKFEEFLDAFEEQGLDKDGFIVLCTDPNDTLQTDRAFVLKRKLTKEEYYKMLAARPFIVMLDDMDTVLHPGTIEFFHYRCPVITFEAQIYDNPNAITDLSELRGKLLNPVYNVVDGEVKHFVYGSNDTDPFYNKEFVSVRQN